MTTDIPEVPKNPYEAFKSALILHITAPTIEGSNEALYLAESFSENLTEEEILKAKQEVDVYLYVPEHVKFNNNQDVLLNSHLIINDNSIIINQRRNKTTIEVIEKKDGQEPQDKLWGLAWDVKNIKDAHKRLTEEGVDISPIKEGIKENTLVATIKSHTHNVPTLLIEHV